MSPSPTSLDFTCLWTACCTQHVLYAWLDLYNHIPACKHGEEVRERLPHRRHRHYWRWVIRFRHLLNECNVSIRRSIQGRPPPTDTVTVSQEMDIVATSTSPQISPAQVQDQKCKAVSLRRWLADHGLHPCAQGFSPIGWDAGKQSCPYTIPPQ